MDIMTTGFVLLLVAIAFMVTLIIRRDILTRQRLRELQRQQLTHPGPRRRN